MGDEFWQLASVKCEFMDIVHSLEPDILKICSIYKYAAKLLCNRKPIREQAIENARDTTLRLGKVTTFNKWASSQRPKTIGYGTRRSILHQSVIVSNKIHLPKKPRRHPGRLSEEEHKSW